MNEVTKEYVKDSTGRELCILKVTNGLLDFTLIPDRSLDIGDIYYKGEKISWDRDKSFLRHPDGIDLRTDGFEPGFYAAVTSLGPEVFGTPDELRTPHGTGAYSKCIEDSISIDMEDDRVCISAIVPIRGYFEFGQYQKIVTVTTNKNSSYIERTEIFKNLTKDTLPLDDAYHIQLCGGFLKDGGRYVLPVKTERMFLRDSAPSEPDKLETLPFSNKLDPIRCYQYIPEAVSGLKDVSSIANSDIVLGKYGPVTCEMLINKEASKGAFIIRPLSSFDRTLLAKRNIDGPMYAVEPCKSRPNSIKQKAIDGELKYIGPDELITTHIMVGFLDEKEEVRKMCELIERN